MIANISLVHLLGLWLTMTLPFYVVLVIGAWMFARKLTLLRKELLDAGILPSESSEELINEVHTNQNSDEDTSNR